MRISMMHLEFQHNGYEKKPFFFTVTLTKFVTTKSELWSINQSCFVY